MNEFGPVHPVTYRAETLGSVFTLLPVGESAVILAPPKVGKSRLVQFLLREDVAAHYLGEEADRLLLVWLDCNRLGDFTAWHLYELVLDALLAAVEEHPNMSALRDEYRDLHLKVIRSENGLLAQRIVERFTRSLCRDEGLTLCLVLDEFDEAYVRLPRQVLAGLRGLRDANKYRLCYLLFTRQHPEYLRDPAECEGLYEQFSRNILYLQPYQPEDARRVIQQLAVRRRVDATLLSESVIEELLTLSGGHPGLMTALVGGLKDEPPTSLSQVQTWAHGLDKVQEECRKLYEGLREEEQNGLRRLAHSQSPGQAALALLEQKGLVIRREGSTPAIFSPLLAEFAARQADTPLYLDEETGIVTVNGVVHSELDELPYKLLRCLYRRAGEVVSKDDVAVALYESRDGISDNRIDAVVTRLRKVIEADPNKPRFLQTVRGRGYRLALEGEAG